MTDADIKKLRGTHAAVYDEAIEMETVGRPYMTIERPTKESKEFFAAAYLAIPALLDELERLQLTSNDVEALQYARIAVENSGRAWSNPTIAAALAVIDRLIKGGE